jgi:hypothetical protein
MEIQFRFLGILKQLKKPLNEVQILFHSKKVSEFIKLTGT